MYPYIYIHISIYLCIYIYIYIHCTCVAEYMSTQSLLALAYVPLGNVGCAACADINEALGSSKSPVAVPSRRPVKDHEGLLKA